MSADDIKKKIDTVGNIKVIFEPAVYSENRILKKNLQDILEKSRVSLRGWSFPHIPNEDRDETVRPYSIVNGIEFYTTWNQFIEIFRLYQSGQFLAKFALYEDTIGEAYGKQLKPGQYLDFLGLIYKITEIVLFIKNLIENTDIERGKLVVEINKTRNRELNSIFSPSIIPLSPGCICRIEPVTAIGEFNREKTMADCLEIGRSILKSIFDDFNWQHYSDQMIKTHQENLVNRRI